MKKILFMIFLLVIICFPNIVKAIATNSSYNNIKIYFFYQDNCKECDTGKQWLEEELKDNDRVRVEYIKIDDNKELTKKTKDVLKIERENIPLIIIGTNYFLGFNNKIKDNLTNAIKSYENVEIYCDVVSKIQNNEDTKDCIIQNKDIYVQSIGFSTIKKIILISVGICLVVSGVFIIKQKNH